MESIWDMTRLKSNNLIKIQDSGIFLRDNIKIKIGLI
jgi:hypothetical protein